MDKKSIAAKNILVKMEIVLDNKESRHKGEKAMERLEQGGLVHPGKQNDDLSLFVGDALALDTVNTERLIKGTRQDLLMSADALARWWRQAQLHYPTIEMEQGKPNQHLVHIYDS